MKKLSKTTHFAIYILLTCVFMSCGIFEKQKLTREMLRVSDLQNKYVEKYLDIPSGEQYELKIIYCDSIIIYGDSVSYYYNLMYPENAR